MTNQQMGYLLLVVGIAIAVLAIIIDPLRGLVLYLHWAQILALVVGVVIALAGIYVGFLRSDTPRLAR